MLISDKVTRGSIRSIVFATVREVLSEPLSLLIMLAALVLTVLAPAFHYHQFGEATRMARDAGFSSLFLGGSALAVFATIRAVRQEIETGTLQMALAHPISRSGFFLGKTLGCFLAYLVFAAVVFATMLLIVWGAAVGGELAAQTGVLARIYGPFLAAGLAIVLVPLVLSALLNRLCRVRFGLGAFVLALALSALALGAVVWLQPQLAVRHFLPVTLLVGHAAVLTTASAAAAIRFRTNGAASVAGLVMLASVPFIGNFYLADSLSHGGSVSLVTWALTLLATLPAVAAFLVLGIHFINARDAV